jgi:hypothetical protein
MYCLNNAVRNCSLRLAVSDLLRKTGLAAALIALTACSDETGTGGGAGDNLEFDLQDLAILTSLVGVFDLTGNWSGREGDAATLVIRAPDADGSAEVVLYDINENEGNCTERPIQGLITVDRFLNEPQVFLNDIFDFDNATLSLTNNGSLSITFDDVNDINANGSTDDRVSYLAVPIAILEQDIPGLC